MAGVPWTEEWAIYSPWGPEELDVVIKPRGFRGVLTVSFFLGKIFEHFLQGSSAVNAGPSILSV